MSFLVGWLSLSKKFEREAYRDLISIAKNDFTQRGHPRI